MNIRRNDSVHGLPLTILASIMVAGCSSGAAEKAPSTEPIPVEVISVQGTRESEHFRYSGIIKESKAVEAAFAVPGLVERVEVVEGEWVKQGALLARLDDASFRDAYRMAEAVHHRALDAVDRLRPMHDSARLPDIDWVKAETALSEAEAALELATKNLEDCELRAREPGVVGRRNVDVGSAVLPVSSAFTLVQIDRVLASVPVHENEISWIRAGVPAEVSVPALGGRTWNGTVDEIGVVADPLSHTYTVKVGLRNPDHALRPGMIGNVLLVRYSDEAVISVPIEAVLTGNDGSTYVFVVDARTQTAHRRDVTRGRYIKGGVQILSGLDVDEVVVRAGQHRLHDGALVRVAPSESVAGAHR